MSEEFVFDPRSVPHDQILTLECVCGDLRRFSYAYLVMHHKKKDSVLEKLRTQLGNVLEILTSLDFEDDTLALLHRKLLTLPTPFPTWEMLVNPDGTTNKQQFQGFCWDHIRYLMTLNGIIVTMILLAP